MIIDGLNTAGALPTLEKVFLFAGARQRMISNNIANIDTPGYRMQDVNPLSFQKLLGEAVQTRRRGTGGSFGDLEFQENSQIRMQGNRMVLSASNSGTNIIFHDGNDRDLERLMQQLVENASMFRVAADLMRQNQSQLKLAIAQRVL